MAITVPVVLRSGLGAPLSVAQGDANISGLASGVNEVSVEVDTLKAGTAPVVSSVSAIRALLKTGPAQVFALGYYAAGDGGGGAYYYDASDTTSTDNGGTIIVASDGGRWKLQLTSPVSVKQFGAKGDGITDDAVAIRGALNSGTKRIIFPAGKYICNSTISIIGARALTLEGDAAALLTSGTDYSGESELIFDGATSGSNGLVISDFVGVVIRNFAIRMLRSGVGGGTALFLYNGHDYKLEHITADVNVGATGAGIVLGNGSGATSTFVGDISNCKVMPNANCPGIYANFGTSLTFNACYVIGGYFGFNAMGYTTINSCAVDNSPAYGYSVVGCSNMVFNACGTEQAAKGAFYLSATSTNIQINAPYGASNNTSADSTIGDLIQLDSASGAVNSITIVNPTSVSPNASTMQNIYANAGTGFVEVLNTDQTLLSKGIGGDSTWKLNKLSVTGYWDQMQSWTPVLSAWTNSGAPTIIGAYKRVGKTVTFYVRVSPGTSISATKVTSTITGFPFGSVATGTAMMSDDNANSYGVCTMSATGVIYPQTSGVLTVPMTFVGTAIVS